MFTLKQVKINGGLTVSPNGEVANFKRGYQVSIKDIVVIPLYKARKAQLLNILATIDKETYLGLWISQNKLYIDCSIYLSNKKDAVKLGKQNNQIAIFNWKTCGDVTL